MRVKFIDGDPPEQPRRGRNAAARIFAQLREHPGVWAEVERYPADRNKAARSRAQSWRQHHKDIDALAAKDPDTGEIVFYARAIPSGEGS